MNICYTPSGYKVRCGCCDCHHDDHDDDYDGCHVYHDDHIRDFVDCTILIGRFRAVIFASNQRGRSTEKVRFLCHGCVCA